MSACSLQHPQRRQRSASEVKSLPGSIRAPSSPSIIRTQDFILLPTIPTHEPEDNLPSPSALQHRYAAAARSDAHARRRRQSSLSQSIITGMHGTRTSAFDRPEPELLEELTDSSRAAATAQSPHLPSSDLRELHLETLISVVHALADSFHNSETQTPLDAKLSQTLDDIFASLRRLGGHDTPLSPTFAHVPTVGAFAPSDLDRLAHLVDVLDSIAPPAIRPQDTQLRLTLRSHTEALTRADLSSRNGNSPPWTPHTPGLSFSDRLSPLSPPLHLASAGARGSWTSSRTCGTLPTPPQDVSTEMQQKAAFDVLTSVALAQQPHQVPFSSLQQQHFDGSVFEMASVRRPQTAQGMAEDASCLSTLDVQPRLRAESQASQRASTPAASECTAATPGETTYEATDSVVTLTLPRYSSEAPRYGSFDDKADVKSVRINECDRDGTIPVITEALPAYDRADGHVHARDSSGASLETPTILERRRARLAAQHSAYAARTPQDLAVVQTSIDHLSSVIPPLDNQRALSPEQQRATQLLRMFDKFSESDRLDDQRRPPPILKPSRRAPVPPSTENSASASVVRARSGTGASQSPSESELPATPTTPSSLSSSRKSSIAESFSRKLSIASITNTLRRASIYDTKPKHANREVDRGATGREDPRSKSDIAQGLTTHFGKSDGERVAFRAIDFADDTPRGRREHLGEPTDEEDDGLLDDYGFASIDTTKSNRRSSVVAPESPQTMASSSSGSRMSSRRSSQWMDSQPATPSWPKSPFTPVSPQSVRRPSKPTVTFAPSTLRPPPPGRSRAASLQSQLREAGQPTFRQCKSPKSDEASVVTAVAGVADASARAATTPAVNATAAVGPAARDVKSNAAARPQNKGPKQEPGQRGTCPDASDPAEYCEKSATNLVRSASRPPAPQFEASSSMDFFAEAQHSIGIVSVLLWLSGERNSGMDSADKHHRAMPARQTSYRFDWSLIDQGYDCAADESRWLYVVPIETQSGLGDGLASARLRPEGHGLDRYYRDLSETTFSKQIHQTVSSSSETKQSSSDGSGSSSSTGGSEKPIVNMAGRDGSPTILSDAVGGLRIKLPVPVTYPQSGEVALFAGGSNEAGPLAQVKLSMSETERLRGLQENRAEGLVDFPLSATQLTAKGRSGSHLRAFVCAGCFHNSGAMEPKKLDTIARFQANSTFRALPSEGWEELVDAWMCHGDQELNASVTETAVKFTSRVGGKMSAAEHLQSDGPSSNSARFGQAPGPVWVGDTYLLAPAACITTDSIRPCTDQESWNTVRCKTCSCEVGEVHQASSPSPPSYRLSKYMLVPILEGVDMRQASSTHTKDTAWLSTLLSSIQQAAASTGARRLRLRQRRAKDADDDSFSVWLFSRAVFTGSLTSDPMTVWRGSKLLFSSRSSERAVHEAEGTEALEVPDLIVGWTRQALIKSNEMLHPDMRQMFPGWLTGYLAVATE
ncbi:hypothetical protein BCV70DRAFT_216424 [Testicularia cyperi]|uniref:HECT domain-containing protein n=1 Tax=Testicularia cyperi TaxID=1882483 RepID=A0A317XSP1_9BASI|nr:hypothetical protein BCV70DRAFT_216424 [Testicularia cyperi]